MGYSVFGNMTREKSYFCVLGHETRTKGLLSPLVRFSGLEGVGAKCVQGEEFYGPMVHELLLSSY